MTKEEKELMAALQECFLDYKGLIQFFEYEGWAKDSVNSAKKIIANVEAMSERFTDEDCLVEEEAMDEDDFVHAGITAREVVKKTAMQSAQEWIEKNPDWGSEQ